MTHDERLSHLHLRRTFFLLATEYLSADIIVTSAKDTSKPVQAVELPVRPSWDRQRDEPFLPLPSFPALRLTPFRDGDDDAIVRLQRDPDVARYAYGSPADYKPEHNARIWNTYHPQCLASISIIRPLILSLDTHEKLGMTHLRNPMPVIRDHTSGQLIGRVMSKLHSTDEVSGKVTWEFGFSLMPEYRGKGVAKEVLRVILSGWVQWVGIERVVASHQTGNAASSAVLLSCGFQQTGTEMVDWPAVNGGGQRQVVKYEWLAPSIAPGKS